MRANAPLWSSGYRPFFLLGVGYGIALMLAWAWALVMPDAPVWPAFAGRTWHAREMLFGFSSAIIAGVVLTALPSWAGIDEFHGARLIQLIVLWGTGRVAMWVAAMDTIQWIACLDLLFLPALIMTVTPALLPARRKIFLWLLPVLGAFWAAQIATHVADPVAVTAALRTALHASVYAIILLYVLVGGLFTPIFTGNALQRSGRGSQAPFRPGLETAAVLLVIALAACDLARAPEWLTGAAALACALVHGWRVLRWRGWRAFDDGVALLMNLGFFWLLVAFALRAAAAFSDAIPHDAWLHAFTAGSLGMMMIGLMTRVVLRHTGRPMVVAPAIVLAAVLICAATVLRLAAGTLVGAYGPDASIGPAWNRLAALLTGNGSVAAAALCWALALALWYGRFAPMLLAPSLPRQTGPARPAPTDGRSARE